MFQWSKETLFFFFINRRCGMSDIETALHFSHNPQKLVTMKIIVSTAVLL